MAEGTFYRSPPHQHWPMSTSSTGTGKAAQLRLAVVRQEKNRGDGGWELEGWGGGGGRDVVGEGCIGDRSRGKLQGKGTEIVCIAYLYGATRLYWSLGEAENGGHVVCE